MWFTEKAWPPMLVILTVALVAGLIYQERRQSRFLAIVGLCVALAAVIWFVERAIVTDRERVEQSISDITLAFENRDANGVGDLISMQSPELRELALTAMAAVELKSARVTDVHVALLPPDETRARSHFRINGEVTAPAFGVRGHQATRWDATWQKEGERWRILDVTQLDPITGEPLEWFHKFVERNGAAGAKSVR